MNLFADPLFRATLWVAMFGRLVARVVARVLSSPVACLAVAFVVVLVLVVDDLVSRRNHRGMVNRIIGRHS